jgi:putative colanic acid biosysnthesis UDP-glucose lipid carrier transferase
MTDLRSGLFRMFRLGVEIITTLLAFILAVVIRYPNLQEENPEYYDYYLQLGVFSLLLWLVLALLSNPNPLQLRRVSTDYFRRWLIHIAGMGLFVLSLQGYYYSRLFLIIFYALLLLMGAVQLIILSYSIKLWRKRANRWQVRTLVISSGEESVGCPESHVVVGQFRPDDAEAEQIFSREKIDEVRLQTNDPEDVKRWFALAEKHTASFVLCPEIRPATPRLPILFYENGELRARFRREPLRYWHNRALKRGFDIFFSLVILLLSFWWVIPLVWLGQRLSGGGKMFFRQSRPGKDEKAFTILKFTSMKASHDSETREALPGDERITSFGKWMRHFHLDEWPQLFNVLRGDMSLVGPRPHLWVQNEMYREVIDDFMLRQTLRPGITGLAQVSGLHGDVSSEQTIRDRVAMDARYVEEWSLGLDMEVLFRTFFLWQNRTKDKSEK